MDEKINQAKTSKLSYLVFAFSITIVSIALLLVIFPALIVIIIGTKVEIDPFEQGVWAAPIVITSFILLDFGILYYTKKLPKKNS